jgi:hypothetical protein
VKECVQYKNTVLSTVYIFMSIKLGYDVVLVKIRESPGVRQQRHRPFYLMLQQLRMTPSGVGQQLPVRPKSVQAAFVEHEAAVVSVS